MTIYICQCPHRLPAKVWTADSEAEALATFDVADDVTLSDALADDMRDAYVTADPIDLLFWIEHADAPRATRARAAWFANRSIRADVEDLASPVDDDDDIRSVAFGGRFAWSENDGEWTLDNQPPVEADDLFHALAAASIVLRTRDRLVQTDV